MDTPAKKHPCPDCHYCQWCSDDRCRLCLKSDCHRKLSQAEQIALYEQLNSGMQKQPIEVGQQKEQAKQQAALPE